MLAPLALGVAIVATRSVSTPLQLQCFIGKNVEPNRFSLLIDREALLMTISSDHFEPTTIPISITPKLIVGRGYIHYNLSTYEVAIPELTVRLTTVPHIWPGPSPKLVAEGRCTGDIQ